MEMEVEDEDDLACMFLTTEKRMASTCLGCIGAKGEKFCTKAKIVKGELGTCGVNSHTKKAVIKPQHAFFQDDIREVAYSKPSLDMNYDLASCVWNMKHEVLTRVQFRELVQLVTSQAVTSEEELLATKERVMNPAKGVSFTPRKKPRFSSDPSWEYAEEDVLPAIAEAPEADGDLQEHIVQNWTAMLKTVELVKANMSKQKRYESEIVRLGEDINDLRSVASRLMNLVGQPADGIKYDLFAIVEVAEDRFMEVEDKVHSDLLPRTAKLEATTGDLEKDIRSFKKNIGADVTDRLKKLEESAQALELASGVRSGTDVSEIRTLLVNEIMPAMRDLWNLYMVATKGPGHAVRPGSGDTAGEHLMSRIEAVEQFSNGCSGGGTAPDLERRILVLETQATASGGQTGGGVPSLFGAGFGMSAGVVPGSTGHAPPTSGGGDAINDLSVKVGTLSAKIKELEAQLGNVTVNCGGQTFRSIEDCEAFIIQHVPGNTYAYFYDMVSLLQRGWGENHISVSAVWDTTYHMKKAGFTCKGEAVIFASMNTILPTCLGELTGKTVESTQPLPAIPTHGHWTSKGGMMGRRGDINHGLLNVKGTLETQQKHHFSGELVGGTVAKELLSHSQAHWTQFQTMLDDFFAEFSTSGAASEAWRLTGMIGKTVLEALHLVRCIAADLSDLTTPVKRAARILWATLQAHRVMGEFVTASFRNDPRVAPIVVLHLLENRVSKSEVEVLTAKLKTQDVMMAKLRKDLDAMVSKVNLRGPAKKKRDDEYDE
jgi:hypothetical protein